MALCYNSLLPCGTQLEEVLTRTPGNADSINGGRFGKFRYIAMLEESTSGGLYVTRSR